MNCVVILPGTLGTRLATPGGDEIWPPTPTETQFGYHRIDALLDPKLVVGDIIRKVWCFNVYQPLIDQMTDMGFTEGTSGANRFEVFPYDWRKDLEKTADLLAARLATIAASGATITLVAHSMGGLIARLALESPKFTAKPWMKQVFALLTLATPHLGAPLALARILGLNGDLGISGADFKRIAADARYPSAYQLLPAPGEAACWDVEQTTLPSLDIYNALVAKRLGLKPALLDRARYVHDTLATGKPADHIRYFFFAGTGHATITRLNVDSGGIALTSTEDAGDGTVPMWSALPRSLQKQLVVGDHSGFFAKNQFKAVFYRLMGRTFTSAPLAAAAEVSLTVAAMTARPGEPVNMVIAPGEPTGRIRGAIRLERTEKPAAPFKPYGTPAPVTYEGPPTVSLRFDLPAPADSGHYRAVFSGEPGSSPPVFFTVTAP